MRTRSLELLLPLQRDGLLESTWWTSVGDWDWSGVVALGVLLLLLVLLHLTAGSALAADAVVGSGSGTCTDTEYNLKLTSVESTGGGTLTFNCGSSPVIIDVHNLGQKFITVNTTINGGDLVTLSGGNAIRLFFVGGNVTFTLQHIVLSNAAIGNADGGAIVNNGTLILTHTTIQNSTAGPGFSGGAIVSVGPMTITDSVLAGNSATNGGALYPRFGAAQVTITNSVLHDNQATGTSGIGGAILVWDGASVNLVDSELYQNSAHQGDAIHNEFTNSTVTLLRTQVHDNHQTVDNGPSITPEANGGGIYSAGTLTITDSSVNNNKIDIGDGGGIYSSGNATLTRVTVSGNRTALYAHGGNGGGMYSSGTLTLTNVTFSNNFTTFNSPITGYGGGLANSGGTGTLTNVTFSSNQAVSDRGGGLADLTTAAGQGLTLKNTLVADTPFGGNCFHNGPGTLASSGFNLSTDLTCSTYFNHLGDRNNQPANLGSLADNGGTTPVHLLTNLPQPSSVNVIDRGTNNDCPDTDARGFPRMQDLACDIGAVEVQPAPTSTPTSTATATLSATPTTTPSATSSPTPTATETLTATASPTPSPTVTATFSPSATATSTPSPTGTATPLPTPSPTASLTATSLPTFTGTGTPLPTGSSTPTPQASPSRSATPTATLLVGSTPCADINQDGRVDIVDFSLLRSSFGLSVGSPGFVPRADLDRSGMVDILDFSLLRAAFGTTTTCGTA